jgi:hypothetical protein
MLRIGTVRWQGKCSKHPRFDPVSDGAGGVKGGCERCEALVEIQKHHARMVALMRGFAPPQSARRRRPAEAPDLQASLFGEF